MAGGAGVHGGPGGFHIGGLRTLGAQARRGSVHGPVQVPAHGFPAALGDGGSDCLDWIVARDGGLGTAGERVHGVRTGGGVVNVRRVVRHIAAPGGSAGDGPGLRCFGGRDLSGRCDRPRTSRRADLTVDDRPACPTSGGNRRGHPRYLPRPRPGADLAHEPDPCRGGVSEQGPGWDRHRGVSEVRGGCRGPDG